jgi:hypothetical protein
LKDSKIEVKSLYDINKAAKSSAESIDYDPNNNHNVPHYSSIERTNHD